MGLQLTTDEHNILEKEAVALFTEKMPIVNVVKYNGSHPVQGQSGRLGLRVDKSYDYANKTEVHCDRVPERTLHNLTDGISVPSDNTQVNFCRPELENQGVVLERGDLVELFPSDFNTQKKLTDEEGNVITDEDGNPIIVQSATYYQILAIGDEEWVAGSDRPLFKQAVVDLEHTWEP